MKHFRSLACLICSVVICLSFSHAKGETFDGEVPLYGQNDRFSQYYINERTMIYSIQSKLDIYQQDLLEHISSPGLIYQTENYRVEIVEFLADNYQAFANVQFSVTSPAAVVRPLLCADTPEGRYYISPEECEKEVYFFEYVFRPVNRMHSGSDIKVGVSLAGTVMNDISTWTYSGTANRFRYSDSEITYLFELSIGQYENDELVIETVACEVTCPVLPVVDLCFYEDAQCTSPAFYRTNTATPEFVIVLTPLDMYFKAYSSSPVIPEEDYGYWIVKIDGKNAHRLNSTTKYTKIPEDISLFLYTDDRRSSIAGQWQLKRVGNCLIPVND